MVTEEKQRVNVVPISKEQHQTEEKRNKRVFGLFFIEINKFLSYFMLWINFQWVNTFF
jgi:hypothetical protein